MSYAAAHDVREQVRQATDIVDYVGGQLELRRQGRLFVARCPWHDDSRPSLQVNPERQSWRCWVCNIGGDVFNFVMQREGVGFRDALQILADRAGIRLTAQKQAAVEPGGPDDKATLYQAMAWAESQMHECLLRASEAAAARQYLTERGITLDSVARFRIGFSPDSWQWLLDRSRTTSFSPAVLEACGLIGKSANTGRPYDRFRGRVIFPIRDLQNRPIALGGRILPGEAQASAAKYVNSPETRLFTKSENLYALDQARDVVAKSRQIVVVEGYTDVVLAHQCGVRNVVAVLGTALNQRHLRILKRFAETVYLVLDGDDAGQRRTNEVLELFVAEQMDLRILTLPDELDPAEFMLERGPQEFERLLETSVDALEHKIRTATRGVDLGRDTHRANRALEEILATIAAAPAGLTGDPSANLLREQQVLSRLARDFRLSEHDLRERLKQLRVKARPAPVRSAPNPTHLQSPGPQQHGSPPAGAHRPGAGPPGASSRASSSPRASGDRAAAGPASGANSGGSAEAPWFGGAASDDVGADFSLVEGSAGEAGDEAAGEFQRREPIVARTLPPIEVELLGLLANYPDLHAIAFDQLMTEDLAAEPARRLFELVQDFYAAGEPWNFATVLTTVEDSRLQSLLVEIDEREQSLAPHATSPPAARLQDAVRQLKTRRTERDQRALVAVLEQRKLGIEKETELLAQLFEQERNRRGLVTPTDGRQPPA